VNPYVSTHAIERYLERAQHTTGMDRSAVIRSVHRAVANSSPWGPSDRFTYHVVSDVHGELLVFGMARKTEGRNVVVTVLTMEQAEHNQQRLAVHQNRAAVLGPAYGRTKRARNKRSRTRQRKNPRGSR